MDNHPVQPRRPIRYVKLPGLVALRQILAQYHTAQSVQYNQPTGTVGHTLNGKIHRVFGRVWQYRKVHQYRRTVCRADDPVARAVHRYRKGTLGRLAVGRDRPPSVRCGPRREDRTAGQTGGEEGRECALAVVRGRGVGVKHRCDTRGAAARHHHRRWAIDDR